MLWLMGNKGEVFMLKGKKKALAAQVLLGLMIAGNSYAFDSGIANAGEYSVSNDGGTGDYATITDNNLVLHNWKTYRFDNGDDPDPEGFKGAILGNVFQKGADAISGNTINIDLGIAAWIDSTNTASLALIKGTTVTNNTVNFGTNGSCRTIDNYGGNSGEWINVFNNKIEGVTSEDNTLVLGGLHQSTTASNNIKSIDVGEKNDIVLKGGQYQDYVDGNGSESPADYSFVSFKGRNLTLEDGDGTEKIKGADMQGDITAARDLTVTEGLSAGGTITAGGKIEAGGDIKAGAISAENKAVSASGNMVLNNGASLIGSLKANELTIDSKATLKADSIDAGTMNVYGTTESGSVVNLSRINFVVTDKAQVGNDKGFMLTLTAAQSGMENYSGKINVYCDANANIQVGNVVNLIKTTQGSIKDGIDVTMYDGVSFETTKKFSSETQYGSDKKALSVKRTEDAGNPGGNDKPSGGDNTGDSGNTGGGTGSGGNTGGGTGDSGNTGGGTGDSGNTGGGTGDSGNTGGGTGDSGNTGGGTGDSGNTGGGTGDSGNTGGNTGGGTNTDKPSTDKPADKPSVDVKNLAKLNISVVGVDADSTAEDTDTLKNIKGWYIDGWGTPVKLVEANGDLTENTVDIGPAAGGTVTILKGKDVKDNVVNIGKNETQNYGGTINLAEASGSSTGNVLNLYSFATDSDGADGDVSFVAGKDNAINLYKAEKSSKAVLDAGTINIRGKDMTLKQVKGFDNLNFYIADSSYKDSTMLTLVGKDGYSPNADGKINAFVSGDKMIEAGSSITLVKTAGEAAGSLANAVITPKAKVYEGASFEYDASVKLSDDKNSVVATIDKAKFDDSKYTGGQIALREQTKSLTETMMSSVATMTSAADLVAGAGYESASQAVSENKAAGGSASAMAPYVAMGGSNLRQNSGSYVDVNGYNLNFGFAKEIKNKSGKLLIGPLFEYGRGNYESHLDDGTKGEGYTQNWGLGVMAKQENDNGVYYEASLRAGRITSDYSSANILPGAGIVCSYDTSTTYTGAHFGIGKVQKLGKANALEYYGKFFINRQGGDTVTLSTGETYDFSSVTSKRSRLGLRYIYGTSSVRSLYAGLAWQYEFDGSATASYRGFETPSPSVKGSSVMAELGIRIAPKASPVSFDLGVSAWGGKQEGYSLNAKMNWTF